MPGNPLPPHDVFGPALGPALAPLFTGGDPAVASPAGETHPGLTQAQGIQTAQALARTLTYNEAVQLLRDAGIDTTNPQVLQYLALPTTLQTLSDPAKRQAFLPFLKSIAPIGGPLEVNYQKAIQDAGFAGGYQAPPVADPSMTFMHGAPARTALGSGSTPTKSAGYQTSQNGSILYPNGVLVVTDPNTGAGQVVYPPGQDVPGSLTWIRDTASKWGQPVIDSWRKKLISYGYLPKGATSGGFDSTFSQGLSAYYQASYVYGKPMPLDTSGAVANSTFKDLGAIRDVITQQVRQQFETTFGSPPNDSELKQWTDTVISAANQLQKTKGLAPSDAQAEAEAQAQTTWQSSPQGELLAQQGGSASVPGTAMVNPVTGANTGLHDAILNAVLATHNL